MQLRVKKCLGLVEELEDRVVHEKFGSCSSVGSAEIPLTPAKDREIEPEGFRQGCKVVPEEPCIESEVGPGRAEL